MRSLRQTVAEQMVEAHRISFDLARYHVGLMAPSEVKRRFLFYVRHRSGAELSAVGPPLRAGNVSSTRFHDPRLIPAGPRHSTLFPSTQTLPGKEVKNGESRKHA